MINYLFYSFDSKEKSNTANATAKNIKQRLSVIDAIANRKMGRKIDMIYSSGKTKVACLEIGGKNDQSKEMGK